jgi:hypothetical protein
MSYLGFQNEISRYFGDISTWKAYIEEDFDNQTVVMKIVFTPRPEENNQ